MKDGEHPRIGSEAMSDTITIERPGDAAELVPDRTTIRYRFGSREITVDLRGGVLRITGDAGLVILPAAANGIRVRMER